MANSNKPLTGKLLNELWQVGAKHALYSKDGKWYHQLKEFPGALFDPKGYIVFETEEDYLTNPYLVLTEDLHVKEPGVSAVPGYVLVSEKGNILSISNQIKTIKDKKGKYKADDGKTNIPRQESPKAFDLAEPERVLVLVSRIVRDTNISQWVKFIHQYRCQICGKTLDLGNGTFYAEAHHIQPLGGEHKGLDVVENILCLCPNHHALLDFGAIELIKSEIRLVSGHEPGDDFIHYHNTKIYKSSD